MLLRRILSLAKNQHTITPALTSRKQIKVKIKEELAEPTHAGRAGGTAHGARRSGRTGARGPVICGHIRVGSWYLPSVGNIKRLRFRPRGNPQPLRPSSQEDCRNNGFSKQNPTLRGNIQPLTESGQYEYQLFQGGGGSFAALARDRRVPDPASTYPRPATIHLLRWSSFWYGTPY